MENYVNKHKFMTISLKKQIRKIYKQANITKKNNNK